MIERIQTGVRMSKIVRHNDVIYLSGQVGEGETVAAQTQACLAKIDALLLEAGSSRQHLLQVIVWLADVGDFVEMNSVWDAWIPNGHAPARACSEAKLARPELKVEIVVTAASC